jgi:DNA-binding SARP family transcriptional activator/Tfp pilus assembly protein PilF
MQLPPGRWPRRLDISVFGALQIGVGGHDVPLRSRRARAVLAFLALSEGQSATRERLCGLFWGEVHPAQAQNSLRQIVRELHVALSASGYEGLERGRLALALAPASFSVDLRDVLADARQGVAHPILLSTPRATETLFAGYDDLEGGFLSWLRARRQNVHDELLWALQTALDVQGVPAATRLPLAQAMTNLDPANEVACRALMQARAELGDIAGALRAYDSMHRILLAEHQVLPADATVALLQAIKQGRFDPPGITIRPAAARVRRRAEAAAPQHMAGRLGLFLEPFAQEGVGPAQTHLLDAFRHDLVASLVRFRDWSVCDRAVASPSGVRSPGYVLEAHAYLAEGAIGMTLTLRAEADGVYVWSERLVLPLADWFAAKRRVVPQLAAAMHTQVAFERARGLDAAGGMPREADDLWRLGQALLFRFNPADLARARTLFEAAREQAPGFSLAYSGLAQIENAQHIVLPGVWRDRAGLDAGLQFARQAVALDPRESRALLALGWALALTHRFEEAALHMAMAVALNPHDVWTNMAGALFRACTGQAAGARALLTAASDLATAPSPLYRTYEACVHFLLGEDAAAVTACDQAGDAISYLPAWRAAALFHAGHKDAALAQGRRFLVQTRLTWQGRLPATDAAIGRWVLHLHPISHRPLWERLRAGLAGAGVPDGGLAFDAW